MRRTSFLGSDCGKCTYELNGLLLFYRVFDVECERSGIFWYSDDVFGEM